MNTAHQPSFGLLSHRNHYLFSDHYLDEILRRNRQIWEPATAEARPFLDWLRAHYAAEREALPNYNESQLEENWFRPILSRLGHVFEVQASVPGLTSGINKPDFVFFADDGARQKAVTLQNSSDYARNALAVGEVKRWGVNLGRKTAGAPTFANNNPMFQIDTYLRITGLDWGIVSDGRFWRLVNRESSYRLDVYFELDLEEALTTADEKTALGIVTYFWLFFGQAAFVPDAHGKRFLDQALQASSDYALALENDLRDHAYKALEQLIQGFFAPSANGLNVESAADRERVYRNSLYLLYRLLFLFYGESRGLLPMHNPEYGRYSLTGLARAIARDVDDRQPHPPMTRRYWDRLQELFGIINGSQPDLNAYLGVPRYNGGLFDPRRHPFLETHFVGDQALVQAIDYLARRHKAEGGRYAGRETVDYRTLGVRQLGSIYEGLLEYRVAEAQEEMAAVRKGGVETWIPAAKRGKTKALETRQPGELYLATDKGERKATGSYYTPDYIVKYIVEQTLGPLVEEVRAAAEAQVAAAGLRGEEARQQRYAEQFERRILALNVLDPAMGSGHFLVDATNFLARALATDAAVAASADAQETDLTYWRRRVVEACIYGVDKNAMAVELAKLSLWLISAAADRPLSFLDHHLRHGDSLVGAWLTDLARAPGGKTRQDGDAQQALFDESAFTVAAGLAVKGLETIEALPTDDIETVHAKEVAYADIREHHIARWQRLADLWVSAYFGNAMTPEEYRALAAQLQGRESLMPAEQAARFLENPAASCAANPDLDYFHWELEFPEVFFDAFGRPLRDAAGFDAVIGNPPYVRQELLTPFKPLYQVHFNSYSGTADLYLYFYEQGVKLLRQLGRMAYISSGTFAKTNSARPFRRWLPKHAQIDVVIDFGENQPFEGAEMVRPSIVSLTKESTKRTRFRTLFMDGTDIWRPLDKALDEFGFACDSRLLSRTEWTFQSVEISALFSKLMQQGIALGDYVSGRMYRGIVTGFNDAFYIDEATRKQLIDADVSSAEVIKPMLRGQDLRPWYQEDEGRFLIFTRRGIDIDSFPAIKAYLERYRDRLEPMPNNWDRRKNWIGRKSGPYQWFEIQDSTAYFEEFEVPKILWPDITKLPRFSWDGKGKYVNQKCYLIPDQHPSLLAVLQSRTFWFLISQLCTPLRLRAGLWQYQVLSQFVQRLPIPNMNHQAHAHLGEIALDITEKARIRYDWSSQVQFRIQSDLDRDDRNLNQKLMNWWELEFSEFRVEVKKAFRRDIPLRERHDWELYLADARAEFEAYTAEIIGLETELNAIVYRLFDLTPDEIAIIERSTKYKYGEV